MLLEVGKEIEGKSLNIKIKGIVDFSTVDSFEFVNEVPNFITEFNIDFSELEFIDSTGISAILTILHRAHSLKAKVNFDNLSDETKELLESIGIFDIKKSLLEEE